MIRQVVPIETTDDGQAVAVAVGGKRRQQWWDAAIITAPDGQSVAALSDQDIDAAMIRAALLAPAPHRATDNHKKEKTKKQQQHPRVRMGSKPLRTDAEVAVPTASGVPQAKEVVPLPLPVAGSSTATLLAEIERLKSEKAALAAEVKKANKQQQRRRRL